MIPRMINGTPSRWPRLVLSIWVSSLTIIVACWVLQEAWAWALLTLSFLLSILMTSLWRRAYIKMCGYHHKAVYHLCHPDYMKENHD